MLTRQSFVGLGGRSRSHGSGHGGRRRMNLPECAIAVGKHLDQLEQLGFPIAVKKREVPTTAFGYSGRG